MRNDFFYSFMPKKKKVQVGVLLNKGYFRNAQLSIEFLLSQRNIGKTFVHPKIKKKFPQAKSLFHLENGATFLAARFNFKHALELSMKSLFLTADLKIPGGHDLDDLCAKMEKQLVNNSILNKSFAAWEWLIKEYSANDKFAPKDARNELDRYMFSMDGKKFPYKNIHNISRRDLEIFLRDIKTARELFWKMNGEKTFMQLCKKSNLDPEKRNSSQTIICKLKNGRYITKRKKKITSHNSA